MLGTIFAIMNLGSTLNSPVSFWAVGLTILIFRIICTLIVIRPYVDVEDSVDNVFEVLDPLGHSWLLVVFLLPEPTLGWCLGWLVAPVVCSSPVPSLPTLNQIPDPYRTPALHHPPSAAQLPAPGPGDPASEAAGGRLLHPHGGQVASGLLPEGVPAHAPGL